MPCAGWGLKPRTGDLAHGNYWTNDEVADRISSMIEENLV